MNTKNGEDRRLESLSDDPEKTLLTEAGRVPDNQSRPTPEYSPEPDPRLAALVRFLARRAADRDYKQFLEEARRALRPAGE